MCQLVVIAILLTGLALGLEIGPALEWGGGGGGASSHLDSCYNNYIGYNFTKSFISIKAPRKPGWYPPTHFISLG